MTILLKKELHVIKLCLRYSIPIYKENYMLLNRCKTITSKTNYLLLKQMMLLI